MLKGMVPMIIKTTKERFDNIEANQDIKNVKLLENF